MEIKECIEYLKEGLAHELAGMKKLSGKKLDKFKDIFYLELVDGEFIYYNQYNIAFTSENIFEQMRPYVKDRSKVIWLEVPEYNATLRVYAYYNDQVLTDYLK